jgi:hypothetical protein
MLHILFNLPDRTLFEEVQQLDESLQGPVFVIRDDFAVGPLLQLDTPEGWSARLNWWKTCYEKSAYQEMPEPDFDDRVSVEQIKNWLNENPADTCWIWMAQNQHDVAGYYWLIGQLSDFQGRVMVLYLNNLPFINDKGQLFYPNWLNEIPVREFLKAKKLARPVTTSEFEIDPDEWKKLTEENKFIRILEGGKKLTSNDDSYFDAELKKYITKDWQRINRILSNAQGKMKVKTGDVFLMSRFWEMVQAGLLELNGNWDKGWKETEIRKLLTDTVGELEVN